MIQTHPGHIRNPGQVSGRRWPNRAKSVSTMGGGPLRNFWPDFLSGVLLFPKKIPPLRGGFLLFSKISPACGGDLLLSKDPYFCCRFSLFLPWKSSKFSRRFAAGSCYSKFFRRFAAGFCCFQKIFRRFAAGFCYFQVSQKSCLRGYQVGWVFNVIFLVVWSARPSQTATIATDFSCSRSKVAKS